MRAAHLFTLIRSLGVGNALVVQGRGASARLTIDMQSKNRHWQPALPVAALSAIATFASASSAMAATDGSSMELGATLSIAAGLDALAGVNPALAAVPVVVGGGGYVLYQQVQEKAAQEEAERELKRMQEFQEMKARDNAAGIISMGLPAGISVGFFIWLIANFS